LPFKLLEEIWSRPSHRKEIDVTSTQQTDSCGQSCATAAAQSALASACTLDSAPFSERLFTIRALARDSLLASRREGLTLHITYDIGALSALERLIAAEADCCPFLDFDLRVSAVLDLAITAPPSAAEAADELFGHFAPHTARVIA
jgi:hypothetical protein